MDFQRTIGDWNDDYQNNETIIIEKYKHVDNLNNMHESILHLIQSNLQWYDLISLKLTQKRYNEQISSIDVIGQMVRSTTPSEALSICIFGNSVMYLKQLLEQTRDIPTYKLKEALIYAIQTHRNEVAKVLIDILHLPKTSSQDHEILFTYIYTNDITILRDWTSLHRDWAMLRDHLNAVTPIRANVLSNKRLLQLACLSNNVTMFNYLLGKYKMDFTYIDIQVAINNMGCDVFREMSKLRGKSFKLSQRMLVDYVYDRYYNRHTLESKLHFLQYVLIKKLSFLSQRIIAALLNTMLSEGVKDFEVTLFIKLVEAHGSQKLVQSLMKQFIHHLLSWEVKEMINISQRLVYKPKHLDMIATNHRFWDTSKIEYMFVNKLKMQERYNQLHTFI